MNPITTPSLPRIALVTTCKNRTTHLAQTLPRNIEDNIDYPNIRYIVLDYNSGDNLLDYLRSAFSSQIASGLLTIYSCRAPGPFRMAHSKNMASRCGLLHDADILVNVDADNFTGPGFASYVASSMVNTDKYWSSFLWARKPVNTPRGCTGRIAVTPRQFLITGGYDEKYDTYGPDDKDFTARLLRLGNRGVEIDTKYLSIIPHNNHLRFKEYPHVTDLSLYEEFELVNDSESTVVNFGNIGCGTVYRNFNFDNPITIGPVPTRIFGIGLHKTATTSLHKALKILGYDSAHWESGDWAKAVWTEMKSFGRSWTMERSYAISDLPIALLYEELDRAYPGSKFILTVRDEDKWIESVRNHWDRTKNSSRWEWDVYPFSNQIHKALYGQKNFDEAIFRARYRKHNADARAYFSTRHNMIVLDMEWSSGSLWGYLCEFLGKPVPNCDYPREYETTK